MAVSHRTKKERTPQGRTRRMAPQQSSQPVMAYSRSIPRDINPYGSKVMVVLRIESSVGAIQVGITGRVPDKAHACWDDPELKPGSVYVDLGGRGILRVPKAHLQVVE